MCPVPVLVEQGKSTPGELLMAAGNDVPAGNIEQQLPRTERINMTQLTDTSLKLDNTGEAPRYDSDRHAKIVQFLRVVLEPGTAVELRAIKVNGNGTVSQVYSTDELDDLARYALDLSGRCKGVYFTLNPLAPPVLSEGRSANANDVLRRRWLLIDADPLRPGTVSSTDAEKVVAWLVIQRVQAELRTRGWPEPIVCDSGNGYHLLYRIDLPTDDGELVRRVLHGLGDAFDTDGVKIDRTVFDPPRICKMPFTLACKGGNTSERPHRPAGVITMPAELNIVSQAQLEAIAAPADAPARTSAGCPGGRPVVPPEHLATVVKWARNYVKQMKPAVEGKGGDAQTFKVVCTLENDYALPFEEAWPILLEWNARCVPPWEEDDLVRKWDYAEQTSKGRRGAKILAARIRHSLRPQ
jgi:hypothetical protein